MLRTTLLGRAFIKMNFRFFSQLASTSNVLRVLGATVGDNTHIHSDICIYNTEKYECENLTIGSNVYVGPRCLFDLTSSIVIEDEAAVSAQVSFVTHLDVGDQPLKQRLPRREGPITVGRGAWIGVNTTILHDVTIGEHAIVGAMSLVDRSIPRDCRAFGIPCRPRPDSTEADLALPVRGLRGWAEPDVAHWLGSRSTRGLPR